MPIPFVGRRFRPDEFTTYLDQVKFTSFKPKFVTLHHTAAPSLAMRPNGFTDQHLQNLLNYYGVELGWSGAPHLFVDDRTDGIIVFQRLDRQGVHAVSFNRTAWGVEMLGDYDSEAFDSGRGAKVRDMAMQALARMCKRLDVSADTIRFHRDDPKTKKTCPGVRVKKGDVVGRVAKLLNSTAPDDFADAPMIDGWTVLMPGGAKHVPVHVVEGRPAVRVRAFLDSVRPGGAYQLAGGGTLVKWTANGNLPVEIPINDIDEAGSSWAFLRTLSECSNCGLAISKREITVTPR